MPSGSHRSSGGSHRSGGSSSSRSSFGGSSSRTSMSSRSRMGGHRRRGGTHLHINGHSMGPVGSIIFYTIFMLVFCGAWMFAGVFIGIQRTDTLHKIETDYIYYQNMIDYALDQQELGNDGFIIEGTVTGKFLSEYADKWYLTYSFKGTYGGVFAGETYAIYDLEDVKSIIPNKTKISLAADSDIITSTTDTVNIDYKNTTLEDDGYYLENKKSSLFPQILCISISIGCTALFIALIVKEVKFIKNGKNQNNSTDESSTEKQPKVEQKASYCNYCGTTIPAGKNKCPNCGAKN